MSKQVFDELRNAVVNFDSDRAVEVAKKSVDMDVDPIEAIEEGLTPGLREIGERFDNGELFLMHLVAAAEAAQKAIKEVFEPELAKRKAVRKSLGRVVLGTVEGDIHDIGKNLVGAMLFANGFEVFDLGKDVPIAKFMEKIKEVDGDIVAASALLSTTLPGQRELVEALEREGIRDKIAVMVGGAPVTPEWAKEIGADGYGSDAMEAVSVAKKLVENR